MIIPSNVEALKQHFDAGGEKLVQEILQQLRPVHTMLLTSVEESRAEVAALAASVTEMRDTMKCLSTQNGGLRNELQTAHEKPTRAATVPPPPAGAIQTEAGGVAIPAPVTKQARDTSPTPTLMHSKHAGPVASVTTGPTQPPPTTSEPPRVDSVETEEGWKKVERKRWKGRWEKKVGTRSAGGVPTCAAMARGGGVSVNVVIGARADYTKPKARRPTGKGKKKQQGHQRPASSSMTG
jgi:hypothetical protein